MNHAWQKVGLTGVTTLQQFQSHGSLTIRIGAIIFGLATATCLFMQLIEFVEMDHSASAACHDVTNGINAFLMMVFVLLQVFVIFAYPRLNFLSYQLANRYRNLIETSRHCIERENNVFLSQLEVIRGETKTDYATVGLIEKQIHLDLDAVV